MNAKQLFNKTKPFCMAKLGLGAVTVLLSTVLFLILLGIGWLFGDGGMFFAIIIWIGGVGVIRFALMHYMGYLVKAGHIAVIAEAMKTGQVPANQVEYGKAIVQQKFATSNIYFAVDKLVTGAVKQIQRGIEKLGNKLDFIPGMEAVTGLANFFVEISLGYIDECCFGWTFYNAGQNAFKSAADGVVIYAQNWKVLLKDAAKTMVKVVVGLILLALAIFIPVGLLFKILKWSPLIAFILACLIAWVVKFAFVDSYIMCQMMVSYMQVAPNTQITFDLYGKLSAMSKNFKELLQKGQEAEPAAAYAGAGMAATQTAVPAQAVPVQTAAVSENAAQTAGKPKFCGQCGAKNEPGTKFCGSCGAPMN